jgi:hypothetical protein
LILSEIGAQAERKGERTIKWLHEKLAVLQARKAVAEENQTDDPVAVA